MEIWELVCTFFKIGIFTFGGGYAMLPLLEREVVNKRGWADLEELMDYYAIGQCTPGVIAVNVSTFIGYKQKGVVGGICATIGLILPSMIVITIVAGVLDVFASNPYVISAFAGVRVCVCVLMLNACVRFVRSTVKDVFSFCIYIVVLVCMIFIDISPVIFVVAAAFAALIYGKVRQVKEK